MNKERIFFSFQEMIEEAASGGWMVGADTAARATDKINGEDYIKWSQEQVGNGRGIWPFWGRYLVRIEDVCDGLTEEIEGKLVPTGELQTIFDNGTAIVLIDNAGTTSKWKDPAGDAERARAAAKALGIPANFCIFVDIEAYTVSSMGASYLSTYKNTIENTGTTRYKMGVYFSSSSYSAINSKFNLANTFTWVADWRGKPYPNWPEEYPSDITGMGQIKLWQFINDQYKDKDENFMLDLDLSLASGRKEFMYHPEIYSKL